MNQGQLFVISGLLGPADDVTNRLWDVKGIVKLKISVGSRWGGLDGDIDFASFNNWIRPSHVKDCGGNRDVVCELGVVVRCYNSHCSRAIRGVGVDGHVRDIGIFQQYPRKRPSVSSRILPSVINAIVARVDQRVVERWRPVEVLVLWGWVSERSVQTARRGIKSCRLSAARKWPETLSRLVMLSRGDLDGKLRQMRPLMGCVVTMEVKADP